MNYSIPTYLSDFSSLEDGRTKARLKVLYVGTTADGRDFDEEFSKSLSDSLDDAPVVAYYSDLKKDFLGHNSIQYVFGHVPAKDNHREFVKDEEDGKTWLMTDVLLYTDRTDNIGEIAKKIIGHPHSLELDPKTVEYEIEKTSEGTKIHFKKGRICGLSVLGTDQKPAFTGSSFLNCSLVSDFSDMRQRFEHFFNQLEEESRGGQMNEKAINFESLANNAKISYNEQEELVFKKFIAELGDDYGAYIMEFYDNEVYFAVMNWNTCEETFQHVNYSIDENGEVTLSNLEEVFRVFVNAAQKEMLAKEVTEEVVNHEEQPIVEEPVVEDETVTEPVEEETPAVETPVVENHEEHEEVTDDGEKHAPENTNSANNQTDVAALYESARVEIETLRNENSEFEQSNSELVEAKEKLETELTETKTLLNAANEELNAFKLKEKENLINSYANDLSEEEIANYKAKVNEFSYKDLESNLALSFTKAFKGKQAKEEINPLDFNLGNTSKGTPIEAPTSYAALVEKWKNK